MEIEDGLISNEQLEGLMNDVHTMQDENGDGVDDAGEQNNLENEQDIENLDADAPDADDIETDEEDGDDIEEGGEKNRKTRVDRRNKELNDSVKNMSEENSQLRNQLLGMQNQMLEAQTNFQNQLNDLNKAQKSDGWDSLGEDQLQAVIFDAEDKFTTDQKARAQKELIDRAVQAGVKTATGGSNLQAKQVDSYNKAAQDIADLGIAASDADFDVSNNDSVIVKLAAAIYQNKTVADGSFAKDPNNQGIALRAAYTKLTAKKLSDLNGENKDLQRIAGGKKKQANLGSGKRAGGGKRSAKNALAEAIATNDWKNVIAERIDHIIPQ